jgi:hypothetical protein
MILRVKTERRDSLMFDKKAHAETVKKLPDAQGKKEYLKFLRDEPLTLGEAIKAQCYQCMGYYQDGKEACTSILCPLTTHMPYKAKTKPPAPKAKDEAKSDRMKALHAQGKLKRGKDK